MATQGYYGGYSLIRTNPTTHTSSTSVNTDKMGATSSGLTRSGILTSTNNNNNNNNTNISNNNTGIGLSRMNFAACNSDWMPSLAKSTTAGARAAVTPIDAVGVIPTGMGVNNTKLINNTNINNTIPTGSESAAQAMLLRAFMGVQSIYRGAPLRVTRNTNNNNNNNNNAGVGGTNITKATAMHSSSTTTTTTTTTNITSAPRPIEFKKKIPTIPNPIGSDTWGAISDVNFTAKSSVIATTYQQSRGRPVAPMAIGEFMVDIEGESRVARRGPEPIFRDLINTNSYLENNTYTAFSRTTNNNINNNTNKKRKELIPVDGLISLRQQQYQSQQQEQKEQKHPVPPLPISTSPLLVPQKEEKIKQENVIILEKRVDSAESLVDESQYISRDLLDEINASCPPRSNSPNSTEYGNTTNPILFGGGLYPNIQSNSLLREGDEELQLFDGDEDEDALERIKRAINIVLSVGSTDNNNNNNNNSNSSPDIDSCFKYKKGVEFDMEWANAKQHGNQENSFFHGI